MKPQRNDKRRPDAAAKRAQIAKALADAIAAGDPLLTPLEAARVMKTTVGTINVWRCTEPDRLPFRKIGARVFYPTSTTQAAFAAWDRTGKHAPPSNRRPIP